MRRGPHISNFARNRIGYKENNEYYTPPWVFEKLNISFDIDVAAPTGGVNWIPAAKWFDLEINGLDQEWTGFIWCNPPYSNPTPFIDKFITHANGIMLVQVSKSNAFIRLWNEAGAIMMLPRNIMFEHKDHGTKGIFMPVALFAMGDKAISCLEASGINKVR